MKICLVTAFPPSHERLTEYGYHLAVELRRNPFLSVTVLADECQRQQPELAGFDVERCWRPDSLGNPSRLLKTIRDLRPDVVWFNLVFATFGTNPAAAFLGLCTPALVRAAGYSTHVTLHHLMENVNLDDSGVHFPNLYRSFGWMATHLLLRANSVTVLLPGYRRTLVRKYRGGNVHLRAHGIFSAMPQFPQFSRRGNPPRILAFGKWGTYKRVELLLAAFPEIKKAIPEVKLIIAGENHPTTPGYLDSIRKCHQNEPDIEVCGYVPEDQIADLFATASVVVMPYTSASGSSGVAHQACQFGLPIVCAGLSEFREMAQEEGLALKFFRVGDRRSLEESLVCLLSDLKLQRRMSEQNYSAAVRLTMPEIVRQYLRSFDWMRHRAQQPGWKLRHGVFAPVVSSSWNRCLARFTGATAALADSLGTIHGGNPSMARISTAVPEMHSFAESTMTAEPDSPVSAA